MPVRPALREYVRNQAENRPGVYRMYGPGEELLYVGKSVHVRTRLLSYFRSARGDKAWKLIHEAARISWEYTPNEFAALIREMKLIQRRQPKFNVRHKRKPIYAFVTVTKEPAPRILPVSGVVDDGATYYGPFPRVAALARTVQELSHVLGLRDCPGDTSIFFDDQLEMLAPGRAPRCLRADVRTCLAPCCGRTSAKEYKAAVNIARLFLEGRAHTPLRDIETEMAAAAERTDYEYAAILRDRRDRLTHFRDELVAFRGRVEDLSFIYRIPGYGGDDRVYLIKKGQIRKALVYPKDRRGRTRVARAVEEVYGNIDAGPRGFEPEDAAEILLVAQWFRLRPKERRRTMTPARWISERKPA